ncbi:MAG: PorV/PorQ family protein [Bacteroidales bacterium]|nr:PorV/PorQ family protein [Bacteroidales bacterium]
MKNTYRKIYLVGVIALATLLTAEAGNKDRSGQAAASELLINPWGASAGWGYAGVASTKGIEATFSNVAGIAFVRKTQIGYSNTIFNVGSDVMINSLGIVQSLSKDGSKGNLGLTATIVSGGKVDITTVDYPEGGIGTYSPTFMNIGVSYGYSFSDFIHAGVTGKIIYESIHDVSATGFVLDIGVQWVAGRNEQFQLGVALKNLGLSMRYKGDGMVVRSPLTGNSYPTALQVPSESSEMPALLAIGLAYDFLFGKIDKEGSTTRDNTEHRLTLAGSFIANAYSSDQFIVGLEYSLLDYFQLRAGYTFEKGVFDLKRVTANDGTKHWLTAPSSTSNWLGPSVGTSLLVPLNKKDKHNPSRLAIDYSYRFTNNWRGCHSIGLRVIL